MKQKLFTLLTLLVLCVTGAWATDIVDKYTGVKFNTNDPGQNVAELTYGGEATVSSSSIQVGNGKTGSFTITVKPTGYKIKTIRFHEKSSSKVSSLSSEQGSISSIDSNGWFTFTPSADCTTATISYSGNGGNAQIDQFWTTLTTDGADDSESLVFTAASSDTPKVISFTSTLGDNTNVTTFTSDGGGIGSNSNILGVKVGKGKNIRIVTNRPIKKILFSWYQRCPASNSDWTGDTGSFDYANCTWTAANDNTTDVTFTRNVSNEAQLTNVHIIYYPSCTDVAAPTGLSCTAHTKSSLTFGWTAAANASKYTATLYSNSECTGDPVATTSDISTTSVTFSSLSGSTTYYCKVQSNGTGDYCAEGGITSAASGTTDGKDYTVSAQSNNNEWGTAAAEAGSLDEGEKTNITATANDGYKFVSWAVEGAGATLSSTTANPTELTMGTANATVTATFRALETYAITYNKGANGTGEIAAGEKTEDVAFTLSSEKFTREGFVQTGWATADGGEKVYDLGGSYTANAGIELFPVWTVLVYTVTYNANCGTCSTESDVQPSYGASLTLPTPTFSGCTFDGWYNNGTKIGDAGASYTPTADITLYAKWTDNTPGKLFSYIDGNYGDAFKSFDGTDVVKNNQTVSGKDKIFTDGTTGAQFVISKGAWDGKSNSIAALAKFANGTSGMSVVIPEGKVATVKILYGSYNTSRKLTVGGVAQAAPTAKFDDSHSNSTIASDMTEVTLNNQAGTLTLGSSDGNIYIGRVIVTDLSTTIEKTIPANKEWITFCSTANLDFSSDIAGLEGAYTITAHADKATALTATKMTGKVKAGTGLLLRAAAVDATNPQVITIPVATTGDEQADNMLKGVTVDTEVQPTAGDYTNLGLSNGEFHPYSAAGTLAAGKAYLQVPTAQMPTGGNNARLYIVLDGEATGIANVDVNANDNFDNAPMYNLAGQKVSKSYKGIVIVNGKKYINK